MAWLLLMAYTSKFSELYKSTHLSYHYLCYLLVGCTLGLDLFGLLFPFRIAEYYFAPLLVVGTFALLSVHKRKSCLSLQLYKKASFLSLLNMVVFLLMLVLL